MKVSIATTLTLIATVVVGNPTAGYGGTVELRGSDDHSTGVVQYEAQLLRPVGEWGWGELALECAACEASHDRKPERWCRRGIPKALTVRGSQGIEAHIKYTGNAPRLIVSDFKEGEQNRVWGEITCDTHPTTGWVGGTRYAVIIGQEDGGWGNYRLHGGIEDAVDHPGEIWISASVGGGGHALHGYAETPLRRPGNADLRPMDADCGQRHR